MNSLVRSKPAEDFLDRCRVLMTSPEGRTTVYEIVAAFSKGGNSKLQIYATHMPIIKDRSEQTYSVEEPFPLGCSIPHGIRFEKDHQPFVILSQEKRTSGASGAHHPTDCCSWARVQLGSVVRVDWCFSQKDAEDSSVLTGKNKGMPLCQT